jgi:hypothetical protein
MEVEEREYLIRRRKDTTGQESGIAEDIAEDIDRIDELINESEEMIHKIENEMEIRDFAGRVKKYSLSVIKVLISLVLGVLFGIAVEKSYLYEPKIVKQQLVFESFKMLRLYLSSLAVSTFSVFLADLLFENSYKKAFQDSKNELKGKSILHLVIGGLLIGFAFELSGGSPGKVFVQLGAGVPNAYLIIVGSLLGSLSYGFLNWYIKRNTRPDPIVSKAIFEILNVNPSLIRLLFIFLAGLSLSTIRYFYPSEDDTLQFYVIDSSNVLINYRVWSPLLCGVFIGVLQFVSLVALDKSLNASTAFMTLVGLPFTIKNYHEKYSYLALFGSSFTHWLTLIFCFGSTIGSFVSSKSSGSHATSTSIHPYNALLSGFLMTFGAGMTSGCQMKHSLSGISFQFIGSIITTTAIFAGAIGLAFCCEHGV